MVSVHGDPVNEPVPLLVNVTVPVGAVPTAEVSVTVAVHVASWLIATGLGLHETDVVVVPTATAIVSLPWLAACVTSPP